MKLRAESLRSSASAVNKSESGKKGNHLQTLLEHLNERKNQDNKGSSRLSQSFCKGKNTFTIETEREVSPHKPTLMTQGFKQPQSVPNSDNSKMKQQIREFSSQIAEAREERIKTQMQLQTLMTKVKAQDMGRSVTATGGRHRRNISVPPEIQLEGQYQESPQRQSIGKREASKSMEQAAFQRVHNSMKVSPRDKLKSYAQLNDFVNAEEDMRAIVSGSRPEMQRRSQTR